MTTDPAREDPHQELQRQSVHWVDSRRGDLVAMGQNRSSGTDPSVRNSKRFGSVDFWHTTPAEDTPDGANGKRIGTAKLGNRDKRGQRLAIGPELGVSGPDSAVPLSQDPAKAREFLGWSRVAGAKSLQPQTEWRRSQSRANPSPGPIP